MWFLGAVHDNVSAQKGRPNCCTACIYPTSWCFCRPLGTKGKGPADAGLLQAMAQENEELRQALSELSQMTFDAGMQDNHPPPLPGRRVGKQQQPCL